MTKGQGGIAADGRMGVIKKDIPPDQTLSLSRHSGHVCPDRQDGNISVKGAIDRTVSTSATPSISLQVRTSAATSAIAVAVRPSCEARCSAVSLHSKHTPVVPHEQSAKPSPVPRHGLPRPRSHTAPATQRKRRPYPSLFVQCTSAPAATSAIAVAARPSCEARCSAVHLHSHPAHDSRADRPGHSNPFAPHSKHTSSR